MLETTPPNWIRFGGFEVHPHTGELLKGGVRVKLHEKPLQLLLVLLAHPGEIVTRQVLQERLWPGRPCLDFDNGLNNAVSRLRRALGDTDLPHQFIETVPHRGYRFLQETCSSIAPSARPRRSWRRIAAFCGVATLGALILYVVIVL